MYFVLLLLWISIIILTAHIVYRANMEPNILVLLLMFCPIVHIIYALYIGYKTKYNIFFIKEIYKEALLIK